MSHQAVAGYLALTLFVGAAIADARPHQRAKLRAQLPAHTGRLRQCRTGEEAASVVRDILAATQSIMGATWAPTGEWLEMINSLTKGER
jgi:hypothetical protein